MELNTPCFFLQKTRTEHFVIGTILGHNFDFFSVFQILSMDFAETLWDSRTVKKSSSSAVAQEPIKNLFSWKKVQICHKL